MSYVKAITCLHNTVCIVVMGAGINRLQTYDTFIGSGHYCIICFFAPNHLRRVFLFVFVFVFLDFIFLVWRPTSFACSPVKIRPSAKLPPVCPGITARPKGTHNPARELHACDKLETSIPTVDIYYCVAFSFIFTNGAVSDGSSPNIAKSYRGITEERTSEINIPANFPSDVASKTEDKCSLL